MIRLRDVETGDLAVFFEHQREPVAVAMVAFQSRDRDEFNAHWAKLLADDTNLKQTVLVDGQVAGHFGSWTADGNAISVTGSTALCGVAVLPPKR
jgi:hypothetical protein